MENIKKYAIALVLIAISSICWAQTVLEASNTVAQVVHNKIYDRVDVYPEFPGGDKAFYKFIKSTLTYPEDERESGIAGKSIVSFVVNSEGEIEQVEVKQSIGPKFDEELMRVFDEMPTWIPGKMEDKDVSTRMEIPIIFEAKEKD